MDVLPIVKSFVDAAALARFLATQYALGSLRCQLITATLRDVYLVLAPQQRFIFYLYRAGLRSQAQIDAEWQFVAYLAAHDVPVAPALPTSAGATIVELQLPEGTRYGVLTAFVAGSNLRQQLLAATVQRFGRHIATIHRLADALPHPLDRPSQAADVILTDALDAIEHGLVDRPEAVDYVQVSAAAVRAQLARLKRVAPAYGLIHGDVIRTNALVDSQGTVTVIDFDLCGLGWRAYDVASYLLTIRGTPTEAEYADAFLSGYTTVRELSAAERAALPLFEATRAIFEIGVPTRYVDTWGNAYIYTWLDQSLASLRRCMDQLESPGLHPSSAN